jgi:histone H3/H4
MYSYPNLIPLNAAAVLSVAASVEEYAFDRIYGAFHPRQVMADAKGVLRRSVERYLEAIAE